MLCRLMGHKWSYAYEAGDIRNGETGDRWIRECRRCHTYQGRRPFGDLIHHAMLRTIPQDNWHTIPNVWQHRDEWERAVLHH